MPARTPLFDLPPHTRRYELPQQAYDAAARARDGVRPRGTLVPAVDERMLDVFARARNPDDPFELRDLWLGRVEHELGGPCLRPALAERWRASQRRRTPGPDDVLCSRATARFVKELFNWYFRDDLYGELQPERHLLLSSGSVDEESWGLPGALKDCIRYALDRDWYGYSDSRGRVPAREAVAAYESARMRGAAYSERNVALTLGGTFGISAVADFILLHARGGDAPVLCGIPNYPPLVESIARRRGVQMVPLPANDGYSSLEPLISALTPGTPLVLLQTVANPTGAAVPEEELVRLIRAAAPSTMILLDECHEWLGPMQPFAPERAAANVVRMSSLAKAWSAPGLKVGWMIADEAFVDEYYEYASTTFGGPPSIYYTLVEVLTRMERWLITGTEAPGPAELNEFEASYGLDLERLRTAYQGYRSERLARADALMVLRDASVQGLAEASTRVVPPRYSVNCAAEFPEYEDSYLCFRQILRETGVAVFPGILTFFFAGSLVRVTTARPWADLSAAFTRLGGRAANSGRPQGTIPLLDPMLGVAR